MPAEYTYAGTHREKERGGERGAGGGGRQGEREREREKDMGRGAVVQMDKVAAGFRV